MKSVLNIHWKDWCWSWSSNTLATWLKKLTHWKRLWCWERLRRRDKRDDREWGLDGIIDSMDMSLSKLWEMVKDRKLWRTAIHRVTKRWTWLSTHVCITEKVIKAIPFYVYIYIYIYIYIYMYKFLMRNIRISIRRYLEPPVQHVHVSLCICIYDT